MSGEDPHAPHHGCGHEGTCSFSLCKISAHHSTSLTSVAVCSPRCASPRVTTSLGRLSSARPVHAGMNRTRCWSVMFTGVTSCNTSNLSFTERQSGVHRSAHRPWSGSLQVEHVYCVLVWLYVIVGLRVFIACPLEPPVGDWEKCKWFTYTTSLFCSPRLHLFNQKYRKNTNIVIFF